MYHCLSFCYFWWIISLVFSSLITQNLCHSHFFYHLIYHLIYHLRSCSRSLLWLQEVQESTLTEFSIDVALEMLSSKQRQLVSELNHRRDTKIKGKWKLDIYICVYVHFLINSTHPRLPVQLYWWHLINVRIIDSNVLQ